MMKLTPPEKIRMVAWTRKIPAATAERFSAFAKHYGFENEGDALDQILQHAMKGFAATEVDATPITRKKKRTKDAA